MNAMFAQLDCGHQHRPVLTRPLSRAGDPLPPLTAKDYQEFADMAPTTSAPDILTGCRRCGNPIPPDRRVYCSAACHYKSRALETKVEYWKQSWREMLPGRDKHELAYLRVKAENNALRKKLYPGKS